MKILLLGKNGQVGWELQRSLIPLGEVIALDSKSQALCGDLSNLAGLADTVRRVAPDIIVNAAAHTAVDKAESEKELAHTINTLAPEILAQEAKLLNALLVHYSTDYVFDGSGDKPWLENDPTGPLNVYGTTKLKGEQHIQKSGCKHLIFRTSWVYGARGANFAKTMLKLAHERDSLSIISDQIGAPTGADLLADITAHAIQSIKLKPELSGLYHLAASGETSWHGYASFVINFAQQRGLSMWVTAEEVLPIPSSAYTTPAKRPLNSRLNTTKLQHSFGLHLPHWQAGVTRMLTEILDK